MRFSLITKLAIATSLVLLTCMITFAYTNIQTLKKLLQEETVSDADKLTETIINTTHYQMLENNQLRVYQMIQEVGHQTGIKHIRMINKTGRIIFSTQEDEIGKMVDKNAEACNMCHAGETPQVHASSMNRSRLFIDKDGKEVLGLAKAIYNQESCYNASCHFHPKEFRVLGVLDVTVSLDTMRELLESYRYKLGALTFLTLLLLWASITLFMQFMINRPLRHLVQQTKQLAEGKLDSTVPSFSSYEMGELSDSFNSMTLNLKKARVELEDWGHTLEQKVEERTDELKRIQGQLVRSEKLASLGELVAGIAHEINNPLTGILMFSSIMSSDKRLDPIFKNDVETIVRETERCARIVRGLLDFSRERKPQKKPSSINAIMDATLSLVSNQSSFHDIEIIRDFSPDLPDMLVDPNQIEQVFVNLILNASHAMPSGGELRLTTTINEDGSQVFIHISDTGCGIPEENLQRIFDPFFTTKDNKGTGLGLSVSYGIIESHGGTIEVQSKVEQGTTFSIFLPVEHESVKEETVESGRVE